MPEIRMKYCFETSVLLIDDIPSLSKTKGTQEEFVNLLNHYYASGIKVLMTSDRDLIQIQGLEERIRSRLLAGLNLQLSHPGFASKRKLLQFKMAQMGFHIWTAIEDQILSHCGSCVRELEGALHRLALLNRINGAVTSQILQAMFPAVAVTTSGKPPAIPEALMEEVVTKHGFSVRDLRSPSRQRSLIAEIARQHHRDPSTVSSVLKAFRA